MSGYPINLLKHNAVYVFPNGPTDYAIYGEGFKLNRLQFQYALCIVFGMAFLCFLASFYNECRSENILSICKMTNHKDKPCSFGIFK